MTATDYTNTYSGGSICDLSVHVSHRLWPQSYHHATYSRGSICESGLSVHNSHRLWATTMLRILVEISEKVAYRSTIATDCSLRAINMLFL